MPRRRRLQQFTHRIVSASRHCAARMLAVLTVASLAVGAGASLAPTASAAPLLSAAEWASYRAKFVTADGRVVDRENGGQSHSEGQGYGMLLAVYANDRATFDRLWYWTATTLRVRSDALLAWRYRPTDTDAVSDPNNASDGDLLVAKALLEAAIAWNDGRYAAAAMAMVADARRLLVREAGGRTVLRPAAFGFDTVDGNRGPVVNPSYYIYSALNLFAAADPSGPWQTLAAEGRRLTAEAAGGARGLVPNWVAVTDRSVGVAQGFPARSSYEAVRIPLYLALAGDRGGPILSAFDAAWNGDGAGQPLDVDLPSNTVLAAMSDPGYRMVAALAACGARGNPIPPSLLRFRPTSYYASSLHLLGLVAARRHYADCLPGARPVLSSLRSAPVTAGAGIALAGRAARAAALPAPSGRQEGRRTGTPVPRSTQRSLRAPRLSPTRDIAFGQPWTVSLHNQR